MSTQDSGVAKRTTFFYVRVAFLLSVLVIVVAFAAKDAADRRARNDWDHTLNVAIVVLRKGAVDPAALDDLRKRLPDLAARMEEELHRYRPGAPAPFSFTCFGPIDVSAPPPSPRGDGVLDLATQAWDSWRYLRDIDGPAGIAPRAWDSRIYLTVTPPASEEAQYVEGSSEQNGRVGVVSVELAEGMVDFALAVAAHELFHTLGANDEYDAAGHTRVPGGLAEPNRDPLYPQPFGEVMAHGRAVSATETKPIDSLDDLAVGATTAGEIGWSRSSVTSR